ncbi:DNA-binding response regulator [Cohnella xylanilytica]|uniref:Response regulator transcription factor n=1 Tax=Cohnella xylanilytica TaxID=557555 RepID=A0A841TWD1_9BACL|nr:response regulator transcription factor [Cohnella xylanilytica]MBB6690483.1 response regulator transcription factor [Cohnella xylanilytica]GIO12379.1 DNA-binding response regulator [Cohnella xylanilytica]
MNEAIPIRVLVADDHPLFRQGVQTMLETAEDMRWIGEATTGEEAVRLAEELQPDVILMDIRMPGMSGMEAAQRIRAARPEVRILMLTMFRDDASVLTAMKAGARGYILKDASKDEILRAIRAVAGGEAIFGPHVASRVIDFATRQEYGIEALKELTPREKEVLALLIEDAANSDIAAALGLSAKTVANHVSSILNKLQVRDRHEAARLLKGNRD